MEKQLKAVLKAKLLGPGPIWRYAVGVSACGLRLTPGSRTLSSALQTGEDDVHH